MSAKVANKYSRLVTRWEVGGGGGLSYTRCHQFTGRRKKIFQYLKTKVNDGCPELFALRDGREKKKKK